MVYTDLLFFLGLLPISVIVSFFDRSTEYKNLILVLSSLIFFSWGKPFSICLMFLSSVVDWALGLWIDKDLSKNKDGIIPLFIDGIINGAILIVVTSKFMYINEDVFDFGAIIIPLSIGFYCLKGFCYVYDVYKGRVHAEKNVFCIITYMTAFFLLPVGAEFDSKKILNQIRKRDFTLDGFNDGLTSFICGFSKAVLLAYPLKKVGQVGLENLSFIGCWAGIIAMIGFTYFLFTGFCDMSYGLGRIYGFEFNRNYKDISVKGVYNGFIKNTNIALSGLLSSLNNKNSVILKCVGTVLLCTVGAFWYNQSKIFVFAGITLGVLAVLENTILKGFFTKAPKAVCGIVTFFASVVVCGMVFSGDIHSYLLKLKGLFNIGTTGIIDNDVKTVLLQNFFVVLIALLFMCTPLRNKIKEATKEYEFKSIENYRKVNIIKTILLAVLFAVCIVISVSANIKL